MFGVVTGEIKGGLVKWKNNAPGPGADPATALLHGIGTSADPSTTSVANAKFMEYRCQSSASSGDNRLLYMRYNLSGAGGGECLRAFTTVTAALGTAHGAHLSLIPSGSGAISGLGVAARATLHIPDEAGFTSGTLSAIQAEIFADGAASDPDGVTELSFMRVIVSGTQAGIDDLEDDVFAISLQGFTPATGSLIEIGTGMGTVTGTIKIKIGSDIRFLPFYSSAG